MVSATRLTVATPTERMTLPAPERRLRHGNLSFDFPFR